MTSSNLLKRIIAVGAAILMAVGGAALPAQAAAFTVTYFNGLSNTSAAPAAEQTDANGQLTVNSTQLTHNNNTFIFLGWSEYDFNGFTAGSTPTIYGTSSVANSASLTTTGNVTLKAAWTLPVTQLQMSNPTEIPIWFSSVDNLDSAAPLPSDFTVTVDGSPVTVASFTGNKIVLATALTSTQQQVRVGWTPAVGRRLVSNGYVVPGFTNIAVTTNSIQFPPTFSNATVASSTSNGASISYTSNFNGDLRYVVKLSSASAPASAQDLASGTYGAGVVSSSGSVAGFTSPGSRTLSVSGLAPSTAYKVWFAGYNGQYSTYSNMIELSFTTSAAPAAPTFTGTVEVGSSVTASTSGQWYFCATAQPSGSLANDCSPIFGQMGSLMGSTIVIPGNSLGMQIVSLAGKHLTVLDMSTSQAAATQLIGAGSGSNNNVNNNVNNNQVANCAGQTGITSYAASSSTLSPGGSYTLIYNGNPAFNGCRLQTQGFASARFFNGALLGSFYYSGTSTSLQVSQFAFTFAQLERLVGRPLVNGDVVTGKIWVSPGMTEPSQTSAGDFSYTVTITGVSAATSTDSTDVTDVAEPLPVWASTIVQSIPTLTKSLITSGGSVALTGGDFADLKSVTIGGKAVAHKLEANGHVTIPVPAGEAGKTADIVIVFSGGTMVVQDGIKYVAPIDIAKIGERPIAIAAGAKKITEAVADQIRQAAFANMSNNTISCVAYAANNTAKAKAAAKLIAVQACGIATKANPGLKASEITVVVNKTKAKKEAVGIKVFKATN